MTSISSVASVFVLLLVTYCYSVPLPTENDYTTASYDFTTGKPMAERESMPMTFSGELNTFSTKLGHKREFGQKSDSSESHEYTTGLPLVERELFGKKESSESHEYTTGLPLVERELLGKKESSESGEHTTERALIKDGHKKRTSFGETTFAPFEATTMISKRSENGEHDHTEGDSDEITTQRITVTGEQNFDGSNPVALEGNNEEKRSVGVEMTEGLTTEYATTKEGHQKRTSSVTVEPMYFEATSMFNERSAADESDEKITTERSHVARTVDFEPFATMESSTDFNGRVESKGEHELTTFTPESFEHKTRTFAEPIKTGMRKDAYKPVQTEKTFGKNEIPSFNQGSNDKSYPKKDNHY